jgi:GNAT superfamily N-acetyltransferase
MTLEPLSRHPWLVPTIAGLHFAEWGPLTGAASLAEYSRMLQSALASEGLPAVLVATSEHAFLGSASVVACDMAIRPQWTPWLAQVFVVPAERGRGIGTVLVNAAADEAARRGFAALYLYTSGDRARFYARLGWEPCDRVDYLGKDRVVMVRRLPP